MKSNIYRLLLISSSFLGIIFLSIIIFMFFSIEKTETINQEKYMLINTKSAITDLQLEVNQGIHNLIKTIPKTNKNDEDIKYIDLYIYKLDVSGSNFLESNYLKDLEISRLMNEFKIQINSFKSFLEITKTKTSETNELEITIHIKNLFKILEQINLRINEIISETKITDTRTIDTNKKVIVFIIIIGIVVVFFLSVTAFIAITQSVSKTHFETILQSIGQLVFVTDENLKIKKINDKALKVINLNEKELLNTHFQKIITFENKQTTLLENIKKEIECNLTLNEKFKIPVLMAINEIRTSENELSGYVISMQDLRELKTIQARLNQSEKMASIGTIAAGVAHEINNPVGFIQSNLSTIRNYFVSITLILREYEKLNEVISKNNQQELIKAFEQIEKKKTDEDFAFIVSDIEQAITDSLEGTSRIREIVHGLRSFSRSDDGAIEEVNINDIMDNTLKLIWNELKYKCKVVKQFGDISPTRCFQRQLSQVFVNILVNAAQAIEVSGTITIQTFEKEKIIYIKISDTGKGIAKENLGKIFDPFFTTKPVGSGTGLGLSISYGIVKQHAGEMEVESEVGIGTTFVIKIPVSTSV